MSNTDTSATSEEKVIPVIENLPDGLTLSELLRQSEDIARKAAIRWSANQTGGIPSHRASEKGLFKRKSTKKTYI